MKYPVPEMKFQKIRNPIFGIFEAVPATRPRLVFKLNNNKVYLWRWVHLVRRCPVEFEVTQNIFIIFDVRLAAEWRSGSVLGP